jgi:hypothetical protein
MYTLIGTVMPKRHVDTEICTFFEFHTQHKTNLTMGSRLLTKLSRTIAMLLSLQLKCVKDGRTDMTTHKVSLIPFMKAVKGFYRVILSLEAPNYCL